MVAWSLLKIVFLPCRLIQESDKWQFEQTGSSLALLSRTNKKSGSIIIVWNMAIVGGNYSQSLVENWRKSLKNIPIWLYKIPLKSFQEILLGCSLNWTATCENLKIILRRAIQKFASIRSESEQYRFVKNRNLINEWTRK